MSKALIKGGYYIKARCIQDSDISHRPPYVREIWDWILKEANHSDDHKTGLKRGQCMRSFKDIQEGLCWYVGYRKEKYKKWQCEKATKHLTKAGMIATAKTTRGLIITVVNYDKYQDASNYDSNKTATRQQQSSDTINKNDKNDKNVKEIVSFLNETTGKSFRYNTNKTKTVINARLNEGFAIDDFKKVIINKTAEWKDDPKMNEYLRPETLFGTKFEGYLNKQKVAKGSNEPARRINI